jgi:hypothetical protein
VHDFLGILNRVEKAWSADIVPTSLMREMILAMEEGTINGEKLAAIKGSADEVQPIPERR